jgi:hypothetical protein
MMMRHLALAALAIGMLAQPSLANGQLTQNQSSARFALADSGYASVDVTSLTPNQIAQIRHLAASNSGVGRIRGQIGAVLRNDQTWSLPRRPRK